MHDDCNDCGMLSNIALCFGGQGSNIWSATDAWVSVYLYSAATAAFSGGHLSSVYYHLDSYDILLKLWKFNIHTATLVVYTQYGDGACVYFLSSYQVASMCIACTHAWLSCQKPCHANEAKFCFKANYFFLEKFNVFSNALDSFSPFQVILVSILHMHAVCYWY